MRMREPKPGRVLPHNLDAEASVLGGILLRNEALRMLDTLEVEDFYSPKHQAVFAAMRNLEATAVPIDPVTVDEELQRQSKSAAVGGLGFIGELALRVPSVDNVLHYAAIVQKHRKTVLLIKALAECMENCYDAHGDLNEDEDWQGDEAVRRSHAKLMSLAGKQSDGARTVGQLMRAEMKAVYEDLQSMEANQGFIVGVPFGITSIDKKIGGQPIGVVTAIYGGSGHGKSTILGAGAAAASAADVLAYVFSCEDASEFWGARSLAQESGVQTQQIVARTLTRDDLARLNHALLRADMRREQVIPSAGWTIDDIISDALARRYRDQAILGGKKRRAALYLDYLQVVRISAQFTPKERTQAIAYMLDRLQWLAQGAGSTDREDRWAVMVASQVKPEVSKERRAPSLEDWVDSASIKTVPKLIFGFDRPATYDPQADPKRGKLTCLKRSQGNAEIHADVEIDLSVHSVWDINDPSPPQFGRLL
jgi:replicative DNA helicase